MNSDMTDHQIAYSRINEHDLECENCGEMIDEEAFCPHTSHIKCHDCCAEQTGQFYDDYKDDLD